LIPLSIPERQFRKARQLSVEYNPVAPDGHARQDDEVATVGLCVVGCTGFVDGAFVGP
jgi:hypothetical protein